MFVEEMGAFHHTNILTVFAIGSIVKKVPRGLRNSKPPKQ